MTRINLVPPAELSDKHLGAEYRELPRIFTLVRKAQDRGEYPGDKRNPTEYTLGAGHCRFFYPRLGFLVQRYKQLVAECQARGRQVSYPDPEIFLDGINYMWFDDYTPTAEAIAINRQRIKERTK